MVERSTTTALDLRPRRGGHARRNQAVTSGQRATFDAGISELGAALLRRKQRCICQVMRALVDAVQRQSRRKQGGCRRARRHKSAGGWSDRADDAGPGNWHVSGCGRSSQTDIRRPVLANGPSGCARTLFQRQDPLSRKRALPPRLAALPGSASGHSAKSFRRLAAVTSLRAPLGPCHAGAHAAVWASR